MRQQANNNLVPELPDDLAKSIEGKDSATASTLLGIYRTRLGERRTILADLRSHQANERTHLAYVRTAISLISFGITLNRFAVFLQQQGTIEPGHGVRHLLRNTGNMGSGMVLLGLALSMWALYRYWHVSRDIVRARFEPPSAAIYTLTIMLLLLGGLSAVWLLFG